MVARNIDWDDSAGRRSLDGDTPGASATSVFASRKRDRALKREVVLQTAAALFLEQGYERTHMTEVARRLGITKPALYNYFTSKIDVLIECYKIGQEQLDIVIADITKADISGQDRVRRFIRGYLEVMTQDFGKCLVMVDDRVLDDDHRRAMRASKKQVEWVLLAFVQQGLDDGSIGACDPQLATLAIFGALNGVAGWYREGGRVSFAELVEHYASHLTGGIAAAPAPDDR